MNVISHRFIGGLYTKVIIISAGDTEKQHKHTFDHQSILAKGKAEVEVDGVKTIYEAPEIIEIKANAHHSVTAIDGDIIWYCQHRTDITDENLIDHTLIKKPELAIPDFTKPEVKKAFDDLTTNG